MLWIAALTTRENSDNARKERYGTVHGGARCRPPSRPHACSRTSSLVANHAPAEAECGHLEADRAAPQLSEIERGTLPPRLRILRRTYPPDASCCL